MRDQTAFSKLITVDLYSVFRKKPQTRKVY